MDHDAVQWAYGKINWSKQEIIFLTHLLEMANAKQTSSEVSTKASRIMRELGQVPAGASYEITADLIADIKSVAASALSQDETPGQDLEHASAEDIRSGLDTPHFDPMKPAKHTIRQPWEPEFFEETRCPVCSDLPSEIDFDTALNRKVGRCSNGHEWTEKTEWIKE